MKKILLVVTFLIITAGISFADSKLIERGKQLFNDPQLGKTGSSCNTCHPNGKGLEKSASKKEFSVMGKPVKSLEEVINFCITSAMKGKALDKNSQDMKALVAYIKSLAK